MRDKLCIVTGASSGIGVFTVLGLARAGAHVVMVVRNRAKGEKVRADILQKCPDARIDLLVADFASLRSVADLADEILRTYDRIDILINNAGLIEPKRRLSQDGLEMTFAVNHLAPFLLTTRLVDRLKQSDGARIINVASTAHYRGRINFEDIEATNSYGMMRVYSQSKLANILFTRRLAHYLQDSGATANCLHPGLVATNIAGRSWLTALAWKLLSPFMLSAEKGAATTLYLALSPEVDGVSGQYFDKCKSVRTSAAAEDMGAAEKLWVISHSMVERALLKKG